MCAYPQQIHDTEIFRGFHPWDVQSLLPSDLIEKFSEKKVTLEKTFYTFTFQNILFGCYTVLK
jgi:hypothetical protein